MSSENDPEGLCPRVRRHLTGEDGGPISGVEAAMFERHIAACPGCRNIRREQDGALSLLGRSRVPAMDRSDPEFLAAVRLRIHRSANRWRWAGLAAAAAILLGTGLFWILPRGEEQEIRQDFAVLQDLEAVQGGGGNGPGPVEIGEELISMLGEEQGAEETEVDWDDFIQVLEGEGFKQG